MENSLDCNIAHDDSIQNTKKWVNMEMFLQKCPEMIKTVDDRTTTLMRSLDAILLATQMPAQQLDVNLQNTDEATRKVIENIKACRETSSQFIKIMKGSLLHHQKSTVESVSKFLHFIADMFKEQETNVFRFAENLMIDRYTNESDLPNLIPQDSYTLEDLLMENEELRDTINAFKDHIDVLDKKEQTFLKQEQLQNQKIEMMQSTVFSLETENQKMKSEIQQMEIQQHSVKFNNDEQTKELKDSLAEHLKTIESLKEENNSLQVRMNSLQKEINVETDRKKEQLQKSRSEINEKDGQMKRLETELEEIKEKYLQTSQMKFKLETEKDILEKQYTELTHTVENERIEATKSHNDLKAVLDEKENTIRKNSHEIETLQKQIVDKETSEKYYQTHLDNEKKSNAELRGNIRSFECQIDEANGVNRKLKEEIERKQRIYDENIEKKEKLIQELRFRSDKAEQALLVSRSEKEKISVELSDVKISNEREVKRMKVELGNLETDKEHKEKELTYFKEQAKAYEDEIRKNKDEIADMNAQIRALKKKNFQLNEEVENISKVQAAVERELNLLKSKRVMQVQLYSQNRTSLTSIVEKELTDLLNRKMKSDKLELEFVQCAKASDIQFDLPVLLLCITVSRLGTDVANTMHGLALNQKTAIMIFHHKDEHALPNQASERVLTGQELKNLGGVFDMAFLSSKGIYDCEMNNNNVISLINFVSREGVRRVKLDA